jgi:hypothetical protein
MRLVVFAIGAWGGRAAVVVSLLGASIQVGPGPDPTHEVFRVFLRDGRVLHSYGECAELSGELVCVVRLGGDGVEVSHDVVTLPVVQVDLDRTRAYAAALRSARYGATRGAGEYADLTADITHALRELEAETDRHRRLGIAQVARRRLAGWSEAHFGYKADETTALVGLLDGVIAELRVAAGESTFSLDLVAGALADAPSPVLPAPDDREIFEAALAAAEVTPLAAERLALLRSLVRVSAARPDVPAALRARAAEALATEEAVERAYRALMAETIARADVAVRYGRVAVMEGLIREAADRDARLGRRRPREMAAFGRRLAIELAQTREQAAAYARWRTVRDQLLAYERRLRPVFDAWVSQRPVLEALRDGRVPRPSALDAAQRRFAGIERTLASLRPLPEVVQVHGVLRSAAQMASQALALGARLTVARNDEIARNAAAAVAGAELLLAQGRQDLVPALNPRKVR